MSLCLCVSESLGLSEYLSSPKDAPRSQVLLLGASKVYFQTPRVCFWTYEGLFSDAPRVYFRTPQRVYFWTLQGFIFGRIGFIFGRVRVYFWTVRVYFWTGRVYFRTDRVYFWTGPFSSKTQMKFIFGRPRVYFWTPKGLFLDG